MINEFRMVYNSRSLKKTAVKGLYTAAMLGPVTSGTTAGTIVTLTTSNIDSYGPGISIEHARFMLNAGLPKVDFLPMAVGTSSYAAKLNTLTKVGAGLVIPTIAGAAVDGPIPLRVVIKTSGTETTSTYSYSFDDGSSYQGTATAASSATALAYSTGVNSGLTITFVAGSYVAGDVFYATFYPACVDGTALAASFAILLARDTYNIVTIAGAPMGGIDAANLAAANTILTACDTAAALWKLSRVETQFFMAAPAPVALGIELTQASILAANIPKTSNQVFVGFGHVFRETGNKFICLRSLQWLALERLIQLNAPLHSIYQVSDGGLPVLRPAPSALTATNLNYANGMIENGVTYDEQMDAATSPTLLGFGCIQSPREQKGQYFFVQANNHADPTSDFFEMAYWLASTIFLPTMRSALYTQYKGSSLLTNVDGTIEEATAQAVEAFGNDTFKKTLVQSGLFPSMRQGESCIDINRSSNFGADNTLRGVLRFRVPSFVKTFSFEFGLQF